MDVKPEFARISVWMQISGMSRTGTYRALADGYLKAIKVNGSTMINVESGLAWMRSLPPVEIKLPSYRIAA